MGGEEQQCPTVIHSFHQSRSHDSVVLDKCERQSFEEIRMATTKQRAAARRNIARAAKVAKRKKTISKLPKKTRTALGKEGAKAAKRKRRQEQNA